MRGKRVVITRSRSLGFSLQARLHQIGAIPVSIPALEIAPALHLAPSSLRTDLAWCNWLMLPSPSVIALWANAPKLLAALGPETRIATMGQSSAKTYAESTGHNPGFIYDWSNPLSLAVQLDLDQDDRLLVLGSNRGPGPVLTGLLTQHPHSKFRPVLRVSCSRTLACDMQSLANGFDAITFTSSSGVHCFMQAARQGRPWDHGGDRVCWACIGHATATALAEYGTVAQVVCQNPSEANMVARMSTWFAQRHSFHAGEANV